MKKLSFFVILFLVSVMIASCSKKDNNPAGPENTDNQTNNQTAPSIPKPSFRGPATSVSNEITNQIKTFIDEFNAYSLVLNNIFSSVQPANSGNEWKWVLKHDNNATETFTATRSSDGNFTWNVVKNGTIDTVTYTNWKSFEGTTSKDGKSGGWKLYSYNTTDVAAQISWSSGDLGNTGVLVVNENSVLKFKTEIVNNSNKSGSLKYYIEGPTIFWQADWNTDGTGTWKVYSHGVEKNSGKF
ncbi:MAG: hypothetical protein ACM34K_18520 [Bacillota bacterium]